MHILHNILYYCSLFDPMHISILSFSLVICYSCFLHLPPFPPTSVFSFVLKRQISVIFLSFPSSLHSPLPNPPPSIPPHLHQHINLETLLYTFAYTYIRIYMHARIELYIAYLGCELPSIYIYIYLILC